MERGKAMIRISPSILAANPDDLAHDAAKPKAAGADFIHIDVGDAEFIPTTAIDAGKAEIAARAAGLPLDVHLMVKRPLEFIPTYAKLGAKRIAIHAEAFDPEAAIKKTKAVGAKAGLAIKIETRLADIPESLLKQADFFVVMSVPIGKSGQAFDEAALEKIRALAKYGKEIESDGGINEETAKQCVAAGATTLVAGKYFYAANNANAAVRKLKGR